MLTSAPWDDLLRSAGRLCCPHVPAEQCMPLWQVDGRDAQLFDAAGLLTQRCVMAHAVFLNDEELQLMASRGSAIAHCPLSNFFFADRLLRVKHCRKLGVKACTRGALWLIQQPCMVLRPGESDTADFAQAACANID